MLHIILLRVTILHLVAIPEIFVCNFVLVLTPPLQQYTILKGGHLTEICVPAFMSVIV